MCTNKGTDQLCSYCTADLRLCFYIGKKPSFLKMRLNFNILEDFENASLYIGYILLKNFLKIKRMYKINILSCTPTKKKYLSIKIHKNLVARMFATALFTDIIETQENLKTASINGICAHKLSLVIANDLKHKKKQYQTGGFLSKSFEALTLFDDIKRKCPKYLLPFDYSVERNCDFFVSLCLFIVHKIF